MQLTLRSQEAPPPALPWHAYPDDPEALVRVYGQNLLTLAYDYPAFTLNTDGLLIQDPDHGDAKYEPYKTQFNLLCDKISQLAQDNGLDSEINISSLAKFRKDLLCGYHGESESQYTQQEKLTFEEIKYNLELLLNHIIKNTDIETLKDVLVTISVCEGGVYADFKRLKEGLTEADGLLEFLQQQRIGFVEALAQKHIAVSESEGNPIDEIMHTHLSIFIGNVLNLMGESLPALNIKDIWIPKVQVDPTNPANIIFINPSEAGIAEGTFKMNHDAMMQIRHDFKSLNTAANMNQALAQHIYEKVRDGYETYIKAKNELNEKLCSGEIISQQSQEAPGIALRQGIEQLFAKFKINHLTTDLILEYDEYDFVQPMILRSSDVLRYYLYAAASTALFYDEMAGDQVYWELPDGYEVNSDEYCTWVGLIKYKHYLIQDLETLPKNVVHEIIKNGHELSVHFLMRIRDAKRSDRELYGLLNASCTTLKVVHNINQFNEDTHDYLIEDRQDIAPFINPRTPIVSGELSYLFRCLVAENKADALTTLMFYHKFTSVEYVYAIEDAIIRGFDQVASLVIRPGSKVFRFGMDVFLQKYFYMAIEYRRGNIASFMLDKYGCNKFINMKIKGVSIFERVVSFGYVDIVELLLEHGAVIYSEGNLSYNAFAHTNDGRMMSLLIQYLDNVDAFTLDSTLFNREEITHKSHVMRALISRGVSILDKGYLLPYHFSMDPSELITENLIEYPEDLTNAEKYDLVDYIVSNLDQIDGALTSDFLRDLVLVKYEKTPALSSSADALIDVFKAKNFTMTYKELFSHPQLDRISAFLGFANTCKLANLNLNSMKALRLYAKFQFLRLRENGNFDAASEFQKVFSSGDDIIERRLSAALNLIRPMYSRLYIFSSYAPSDMPVEMANKLRL